MSNHDVIAMSCQIVIVSCVLLRRLKRSNSQELDEQVGDFRRGGVRSTVGGRLGAGSAVQYDFETPFARWDGDRVSTWLHNVGLSMYVGSCKRWAKNGEQLLRATSHDLEKVTLPTKSW